MGGFQPTCDGGWDSHAIRIKGSMERGLSPKVIPGVVATSSPRIGAESLTRQDWREASARFQLVEQHAHLSSVSLGDIYGIGSRPDRAPCVDAPGSDFRLGGGWRAQFDAEMPKYSACE